MIRPPPRSTRAPSRRPPKWTKYADLLLFLPEPFSISPPSPSVSTHRPRYRYIAFRVDGPRPFRREEVLEALRTTTPRLWLVDFAGTLGLARTTHLEKDAAIHALNDIRAIGGATVPPTEDRQHGTNQPEPPKNLDRPGHHSRRPNN